MKHEDKWQESAGKEMKRAFLSLWVLRIIENEGKMYGYEIIQTIGKMTGGKWEPKPGTIYPVLRRLEKKGFVKSEWSSRKLGEMSRRYYKITPKGKRAARMAFTELRKLMVGFKGFMRELFGVD